MGIEELRAALEQEGGTRVAAILREAEAEATRLREAAEAAAARRRAEELSRRETGLRREARARVAPVRTELRRLALEAREEFLARVFARAADDLSSALDAPEARPWLVARALEALAHLPDGPARLTASCDLADALEARADVRVEYDPQLAAGFRASSADGAIVVDATVPMLIEQARATLAVDVLGWFEQSATNGGDPA